MALKSAGSIRLVAFDLDGTLIDGTVFIWQTLHEHFATDGTRRRQAADDYFSGRISYRQWFENDLELLRARGADRRGIGRALEGLRPVSGASQVLAELRWRGYRLALISGSLDVALEYFFKPALFDHVFINRLHFAPDGAIAGGEPTPYDLAGKAEGLREAARREGVTVRECAFVGDNDNDLQVMQAAGYVVAVNPKSERVRRMADLVIDNGDLRPILSVFKGVAGPEDGGHGKTDGGGRLLGV